MRLNEFFSEEIAEEIITLIQGFVSPSLALPERRISHGLSLHAHQSILLQNK